MKSPPIILVYGRLLLIALSVLVFRLKLWLVALLKPEVPRVNWSVNEVELGASCEDLIADKEGTDAVSYQNGNTLKAMVRFRAGPWPYIVDVRIDHNDRVLDVSGNVLKGPDGTVALFDSLSRVKEKLGVPVLTDCHNLYYDREETRIVIHHLQAGRVSGVSLRYRVHCRDPFEPSEPRYADGSGVKISDIHQ